MRPLLLLVLLACGGKADDTGADGGPVLEVAGRYNVFITTISGCENDPVWVQPWAEGPLTVSQDGDALSFDFGADMVFGGAIDANRRYTFGGDLAYNGAALAVQNAGYFDEGSDGLSFSGEFEIVVDDDDYDTNNCTVNSALEGYEVQGGA